MSEPNTAGPSSPPHYTWGQIAAIVFGVVFLLPGLCTLVVMVSMVPWNMSDPFLPVIVALWTICFLISAGGAGMIYAARRRARGAR